ncbi:MAG: methionyl-tRNA formyltransferase [Chitinophagales bacterium]|nr:methionyl-tRNA formyltransferase [Chitinophagales bacterium]
MGTPDFAVATLEALIENGYQVVGVVTATDKPAGRGNLLQMSAVKKYALAQGLTVLQPEKLRAPEFVEALAKLKADIQIVVAFRMLPEIIWSMPPMGTFNLHGSLLPNYRGAAPINWAVINGEQETGVTTFFIQHEIDTGNILLQSKMDILPDYTAGDVHDRMMHLGAQLVVETLEQLLSGSLKPYPQQLTGSEKPAPKIFKDDCQINWNQDAETIRNHIRGLSPYPSAFTFFNGKVLKVFSAVIATTLLTPGTFVVEKDKILVGTATQALELKEIQLEGKKRMSVKEFLLGYRV